MPTAGGKEKSPHDCKGFSSLPLVDAFRTFCAAPTAEVRVALHWCCGSRAAILRLKMYSLSLRQDDSEIAIVDANPFDSPEAPDADEVHHLVGG